MSEDYVFALNRKTSVTEKRIKVILWYILECYSLIIKKNEKYSQNWVKNNTSFKFENYLRNRLVEDYLIANKNLLRQKIPALNDINFSYETEKEYIDTQDNKQKSDKIDIYINKLGLQKEWKEQDENVYFAIECKRIRNLDSDIAGKYGYISDIKKFTIRNHIKTRLPFEGQIAFIENQNINHTTLRKKINDILLNLNSIITDSFLNSVVLNDKYNGTYLSIHQQNMSKQNFSIYHLFLSYSTIVIN